MSRDVYVSERDVWKANYSPQLYSLSYQKKTLEDQFLVAEPKTLWEMSS